MQCLFSRKKSLSDSNCGKMRNFLPFLDYFVKSISRNKRVDFAEIFLKDAAVNDSKFLKFLHSGAALFYE